MHIVFDPLAQQEFAEAVEWYDGQVSGLGTRFSHEARSSLNILLNYPEIGSEERPGIRRFTIKKFPYKLIYAIIDEEVTTQAGVFLGKRAGPGAPSSSSAGLESARSALSSGPFVAPA